MKAQQLTRDDMLPNLGCVPASVMTRDSPVDCHHCGENSCCGVHRNGLTMVMASIC